MQRYFMAPMQVCHPTIWEDGTEIMGARYDTHASYQIRHRSQQNGEFDEEIGSLCVGFYTLLRCWAIL